MFFSVYMYVIVFRASVSGLSDPSCPVVSFQIRFNCRLKITRVQLTGDLTFVGATGPKSSFIHSFHK